MTHSRGDIFIGDKTEYKFNKEKTKLVTVGKNEYLRLNSCIGFIPQRIGVIINLGRQYTIGKLKVNWAFLIS